MVALTPVEMGLAGLAGLLGLVMAYSGAVKFRGGHVGDFERYGYPQWFRLVVGALELGGGVVLAAGALVEPILMLTGGALLAIVLTGAVATHLRVGDSVGETVPAAVLLVFVLIVLGVHPSGVVAFV